MTQNIRIWHIPQVPGPMMTQEVPNLETAKFTIKVLADYDLFQYQNKIKSDYANASGIEVLVDDEWEEFDQEDERHNHFL